MNCTRTLTALVALLITSQSWATLIVDRTSLDAMLSSSTTEDFEGFVIADGGAVNTDVSVLDATSVVNGQGPGVVDPGVTYTASGVIQWNGDGYYGLTSRTILSNQDDVIDIDFAGAVDAFGLDILVFDGFADTATVQVFGIDDTTLLAEVDLAIADSAGAFFGWEEASGIGRFSITGATFSWSPIIDNLTYGTGVSVPEPGSLALLGAGLLGLGLFRRRKPG